MRHIAILIFLFCLTVPLHAQDEPTPYDMALQRIQTATTRLDLANLGLTELPLEIGRLTNLQELWLNDNELKNLPAEIGQLTHLRLLYVHSNQLTSVPIEIGQLTNLEALYLYDNQLASLPVEIGQLSNLQELYLSGNLLTSLPPEIGQLDKLQVLSVQSNHLSSVPIEIGQLRNLRRLYLDSNQLRHLPTEIGKLNMLACADCLRVDDNPLISPPPVVIEHGTTAVLAYLRNQAEYHMLWLTLLGALGAGLLMALLLGVWYMQSQRRSKANGDDVAMAL